MSELEPCRFCGAGKDCPPKVGDDDFVSCRYCGARASFDRWDDRAAPELPELPEGYRVELEHNDLFLCCGNDVVARLHQDDGRLKLVGTLLGGSLHQTHFDALAAFLQGAR